MTQRTDELDVVTVGSMTPGTSFYWVFDKSIDAVAFVYHLTNAYENVAFYVRISKMYKFEFDAFERHHSQSELETLKENLDRLFSKG